MVLDVTDGLGKLRDAEVGGRVLTLAKTNPLLKPQQLQDVVVDGISTGVVKPSHTGQAEISQAVRSSLDPLWKPEANVRSVLDTVCTTIAPLLAK